jgi:hypothetical protein
LSIAGGVHNGPNSPSGRSANLFDQNYQGVHLAKYGIHTTRDNLYIRRMFSLKALRENFEALTVILINLYKSLIPGSEILAQDIDWHDRKAPDPQLYLPQQVFLAEYVVAFQTSMLASGRQVGWRDEARNHRILSL